MELLDYEKKHIDFLNKNACESVLFLKKNLEFPLEKPCSIVLIGNGARQTIKGGTGSGDVASRFFVNFETGLENKGFVITSKKWLDDYDIFKKSIYKNYVKHTIKEARKAHILSAVYSMGYFDNEKDYDIDVTTYNGDACVYILARNSGEGNDRRNIQGDILLSNKEVEDILFLNKKFKKFMLVLNVGGVVDLTPVIEVSNILYISQLGVVTGNILPNILLGNINPSGKLSTTWAKVDNYPYFNEFGKQDETYYKEGIYVGYRYFDSSKKDVYFPFGFGLSYTDFIINTINFELMKTKVIINANVKNIGQYSGKEVVQVYLSSPQGKLHKVYQELASFEKTKLLNPQESENLSIDFDIKDFASYDEDSSSYLLEKGMYIVRIGNSSRNTTIVGAIKIDTTICVKKLQNKLQNKQIKELEISINDSDNLDDVKIITLDEKAINTSETIYKKDIFIDENLTKLTTKQLMLLTLGHHKKGLVSIVGETCNHVVGAAGETAIGIIDKSITMADGPAGIRLKQSYGVNKKGVFDTTLDPLMEKMMDFIPAIARPFMKPKKNKKGKIYYQYTTAIPIGTALAQSFNKNYVYEIGNIIGREMEIFNIDLWLAPALNIHRNIRCGRNFEYYSEDPLLSGMIASYISLGVQSHKGKGVTIKHFACNNQEFNRNNNNSNLSERTLREIYLRGFEICIKNANPKAIMTSYNLINGKHSSESYELINDILRCEWNYNGLVMTDWIASGRSFCRKSKYLAPYASNNVLAGNDLTMPGCKKDEKDIYKALKTKKLTREDLLISASRIVRSINNQK